MRFVYLRIVFLIVTSSHINGYSNVNVSDKSIIAKYLQTHDLVIFDPKHSTILNVIVPSVLEDDDARVLQGGSDRIDLEKVFENILNGKNRANDASEISEIVKDALRSGKLDGLINTASSIDKEDIKDVLRRAFVGLAKYKAAKKADKEKDEEKEESKEAKKKFLFDFLDNNALSAKYLAMEMRRIQQERGVILDALRRMIIFISRYEYKWLKKKVWKCFTDELKKGRPSQITQFDLPLNDYAGPLNPPSASRRAGQVNATHLTMI